MNGTSEILTNRDSIPDIHKIIYGDAETVHNTPVAEMREVKVYLFQQNDFRIFVRTLIGVNWSDAGILRKIRGDIKKYLKGNRMFQNSRKVTDIVIPGVFHHSVKL
jgi:hypothetical protein